MDPNTLVLREYETFGIGERWDAGAKTISREDAARIDRYQNRASRKLIDFAYNSARATNWVGTLGLGNRMIEVVPKIDSSDGRVSDARTRENLLHMISRAGYVPLAEADMARMTGAEAPLLAGFLSLYVDHLTREWRKGAVKAYVARSENRPFLKGKLLFRDQLRLNLVQRQRFFTRCDEFIEDGPVSRLLKAALFCCVKQKIRGGVSRRAKGLMHDFEGVALVDFSTEQLARIQVDRRIDRFAPLVHLAKLIVQTLSPRSSENGNGMYSLMFDMNEVFERFVAAELERALWKTDLSVRSQVGGKSLLLKNGRGKFNLRPDMGVFSKDKAVCVMDTKWKRLDLSKPHANVSQADMYQMYAYGKEFDSPLTVLIYPRFGNLPENVGEYTHHPESGREGPDPMILVRTVDISSPMVSPDARTELARSLYNSVFYGKNITEAHIANKTIGNDE